MILEGLSVLDTLSVEGEVTGGCGRAFPWPLKFSGLPAPPLLKNPPWLPITPRASLTTATSLTRCTQVSLLTVAYTAGDHVADGKQPQGHEVTGSGSRSRQGAAKEPDVVFVLQTLAAPRLAPTWLGLRLLLSPPPCVL